MISEFPLFVFTTLAGIAAGAYVARALFPAKTDTLKQPWLFPLVCLVLLGLGLLGCLFHLPHPERFLSALANPSAGIAQEAYASMAFGVVVLIDVILSKVKGKSPRALHFVGAAFGLILTIVMGMAYFTAYGVMAWSSIPTLPLFVVGDLAMGAALYACLQTSVLKTPAFKAYTLVILGVMLITLIAEAIHFTNCYLSAAPFVVAVVVGCVIPAVVIWMGSHFKSAQTAAIVLCACCLVGIAIARYAFYAASFL